MEWRVSSEGEVVEQRCEKLVDVAKGLASSLNAASKVEIARLPMAVRKMTIQEFQEKYGESMEEIFNSKKEEIENRMDVPQTPSSNRMNISTPQVLRSVG